MPRSFHQSTETRFGLRAAKLLRSRPTTSSRRPFDDRVATTTISSHPCLSTCSQGLARAPASASAPSAMPPQRHQWCVCRRLPLLRVSARAPPCPPCADTIFLDTQRFSSSSSSASEAASSQWKTTVAASAATALAIGSSAWYYHAYGRDAYAMTPAEEG